MTVNDLINTFNIKSKINVSPDTIVTFNDIEKGKYFPSFRDNENLGLILTGLSIINNEVALVKTNINGIIFENDNVFPPCGGSKKLEISAIFSLYAVFIDGHEEVIAKDKKSSVNAIIRLIEGSDLFTVNGNTLINDTPNNSSESISVKIKATYYNDGVKYEAEQLINQSKNVLSSWLVLEEPTKCIRILPDKTTIDKNGDRIHIAVEREFTRVYGKKDACGVLVEQKEETGNIEDITNKCLLTINNDKSFILDKNYLTIRKQPIGGFPRKAILSARYLHFTDSCTILQEAGGVLTYEHELSFNDGKKIKFEELNTSMPTTVKIPIIASESKYGDGVLISKYNTNEVSVTSDSEWVYGTIGEDSNGMNVMLSVVEKNADKNNGREATITLVSTDDKNLSISLVLFQPALKIKDDTFKFSINKQGIMTSEELDNTNVIVSPRRLILYEDGDFDELPLEDFVHPDYEYVSNNDAVLRINGWRKENDDYILNIVNGTKYSISDTELKLRGLIKNDNGEIIFSSNYFIISVKGTTIVDYKHELCFEDHIKTKDIIFKDDEPKILKINSIRHKIVNGKEVGVEHVPYRIIPVNTVDSKCFSFTLLNNEDVNMKPYIIDENKKSDYVIIQSGSNKKISFSASYMPNSEKPLLLSIILHSNSIGKNLYTDDSAYALIDGSKRINLNPCWLYPNIKDGYDTAYNGALSVYEGEHEIEIFNLKIIDYANMSYREIKYKKKFMSDEKNNVAIIKIDI